MVTTVAIRRAVLATCALGIAGMIVSSIRDATGAALTFGLVTAAAVLCSLVATAVTNTAPATDDADELGRRVEEHVEELVDAGIDEGFVRALVADAVRLGRASR